MPIIYHRAHCNQVKRKDTLSGVYSQGYLVPLSAWFVHCVYKCSHMLHCMLMPRGIANRNDAFIHRKSLNVRKCVWLQGRIANTGCAKLRKLSLKHYTIVE